MQKNIHPNYHQVKTICTCGSEKSINSTIGSEELNLDVCSKCHPFYTGKQKMVDTAGVIENFNKRYARRGKK